MDAVGVQALSDISGARNERSKTIFFHHNVHTCHGLILVYAPYVQLMHAVDSWDSFQFLSDGVDVHFARGTLKQD